MKPWAKISLIVACVVIILPLLPLAFGLGLAGLGLGALLLGPLLVLARGTMVAAGFGFALLGVAILGALTVLSPVWIPVAALVALILWLKKPAPANCLGLHGEANR